jgi:hypothetical protein
MRGFWRSEVDEHARCECTSHQRYVQDGYSVYVLSGIDAYNLRARKIDLKQLGAQLLKVPDEQ